MRPVLRSSLRMLGIVFPDKIRYDVAHLNTKLRFDLVS